MEKKKVLLLNGLHCAGCATKIENQVGKISGVQSAIVDFTSKKLIIEVINPQDIQKIIKEASKIAMEAEPDITVTEQDEPKEKTKNKKLLFHTIRVGIGAVIFLTAVIWKLPTPYEFSLFLLSYLLIGGDILLKAAKNLMKGRLFDENSLMSIATIGAFAIREYPEGVAVMLFYQIGEFFQELAVDHSRQSISTLMNIRPDTTNLKVGDQIKSVPPQEVKIGDIIFVKPGEKIPLDGKVIEGSSMLDTSSLTGESIPREISEGDEALSGAINLGSILTIEVTKEFGESTVSKILDLVENASSKKSKTEHFMTKFAKYYTPAVFFSALALAVFPPLFLSGESFSVWFHRALVFLVVSCPCALVVSIPLGFFGGIGGASKNGILVKGSNFLEALSNVDTVIFDKTGTLTKGTFSVTEVVSTGDKSKEEILKYAAYVESYSSHPIAVSILKAYGKEPESVSLTDFTELYGHGIKVKADGVPILAGNGKLMKSENISFSEPEGSGTIIHVAIDKIYAGYIVIEDQLKEDAKNAIEGLRKSGVKRLIMLSGDRKAVAEKVGNVLQLDQVYGELLPDQKVALLEEIERSKQTKGSLLFAGDGINDAPVLARADIGVAMGGVGSDAAIEAADVVLMKDQPSKLVDAIKIAKKTLSIVWQNIFFAFAVKAVVLLLGAGGIATMWEAVFADVGVALIAVLNSIRASKV